ncbi:MAG: HDIG domain-containing protein [Candidatus Sericytochromatia bacterium]|nr:HDIG domain-containing protein [Candidatus Sericytochromatia bacterium]
MTDRLISLAQRVVPPRVQSMALQPSTHQALNVLVASLLSLLLLVLAQPRFATALAEGHWLPLGGLVMVLGTVLALIVGYLRQYEATVVSSIRQLYLITLVVVGTLAAAWAFSVLRLDPFVSPLVACGMLLTVFVNSRVALVISFPMALFLVQFPGHDGTSTLVSVMALMVAVYAVSRVQQRYDVVRAGGIAALMAAWSVAALFSLDGVTWQDWGLHAVSAAGSGFGSAILVVGVLPLVEDLFGITTTFKLLELASPSQPLLRELQMKAPGTYHHSILVGNLAEAAAEAIGADALLVRVGAYYHDIGKTKRPYFFVENQLGMANQHDRISPRLSALVITAHVKEGLDMAREHNLPGIIQDFIATHHGTSLVSFFYHQAVQAEGQRQVQEEHFRYPGPRPRTRETGIVMLADGVEASCRSLKHPTPEQIEAMVRKIVEKRLSDGELSEAPLTLKEIDKISAAFIRVLSGLFHQRIEYPDQVFRELRGGGIEMELKGRRVAGLSK